MSNSFYNKYPNQIRVRNFIYASPWNFPLIYVKFLKHIFSKFPPIAAPSLQLNIRLPMVVIQEISNFPKPDIICLSPLQPMVLHRGGRISEGIKQPVL